MTIRFLFTTVLAVALASPVPTKAADTASSLVGEELQVFPGDKFYAEGDTEEKPVLELAKPFEGRMPGSMRIPFSFAIDNPRKAGLSPVGRNEIAPHGCPEPMHPAHYAFVE